MPKNDTSSGGLKGVMKLKRAGERRLGAIVYRGGMKRDDGALIENQNRARSTRRLVMNSTDQLKI